MSVEVYPDEAIAVRPVEPPSAPKRTLVAVPENIRRRLESVAAWEPMSWLATGWVTAIGALLHFINLGTPNQLVFDEVYYATEGQELIDHSVEWRTETDSAGNVVGSHADFVVHPPLGKWIIALGIKLFNNGWAREHGFNAAFGYRFTGALLGTIAILLVARIGRRMFKSTVLGCLAGLLMALDGFEMVLARTAILDIFVLFFALVAFGCLIMDRDQRRRRWLRELENGLDPSQPGRRARPRLTWASVPWWRLATGVALGLGCGVKWSIVFYVPLFLALMYFWEVGLRRTVGAPHPWRDAFLDEIGWIVAAGALVLVAYLSTWTGWFLTDTGWKRHYLANELGKSELPVFGALQNLLYYHLEVLTFHTGLDAPHQYQSWPWQWLLLARPVAFYWNGDVVCGAPQCAGEILLLGTPVLWWAFLPALVGLGWFGISRRDWRALAIGAAALAGIVPWFRYEISDRTMFYFYAAPAEPFLILAVVYVIGCFMNGPGVGRLGPGRRVRSSLALPKEERRLYGTIVAGAFVVLVALCFWWYYPLYVGTSIPYADWLRRMLLGNRWV